MSNYLYKTIETLAMLFFASTVVLVLVGAIGRTVGTPMIWAVDLAQTFFAWACVFGADITLKNKGHIVINVLVIQMPKIIQTILTYAWQIAIAIFLCTLVWLGTKLTLINTQRELGDLGISYAWVTASIPVGCSLMLITTITHIINYVTGREPTTIAGKDGESL